MGKRALIAGATVSFGLAAADLALLNLHLVPTALVRESVAAEAVAEPAPAAEPEPAAVDEPAPADEPALASGDQTEVELAADVPAEEPAADEPAEEPAAEPVPAAVDHAPAAAAAEPARPRAGGELVVIRFATAGAALDGAARDRLDEVAAALDADPSLHTVIEGHADERGTQEYNDELAERRATEVAEYLLERGVAADRLVTQSFGESRPLVPGEGGQAWRENRRVELRIERGRP